MEYKRQAYPEGASQPKQPCCPICQDTIELVSRTTCPSCEVNVLDMKEEGIARRAREMGIRSVPAVLIDGRLAECCAGHGPDEETLRALIIGKEQ